MKTKFEHLSSVSGSELATKLNAHINVKNNIENVTVLREDINNHDVIVYDVLIEFSWST